MPLIIARCQQPDSRICQPAQPEMRMRAGRNRLVSQGIHLIMRLAAAFGSSERSVLVLVGTSHEVASSANLSRGFIRLLGDRGHADMLATGPIGCCARIRRQILPRLS